MSEMLAQEIHAVAHQPLHNGLQSVPFASVLIAGIFQTAAAVRHSDNSLRAFAYLDDSAMKLIVEASVPGLIKELCAQGQKLRMAYDAMVARTNSQNAGGDKFNAGGDKFNATTLTVGSASDFHRGLLARLGQGPNLDFLRAMRREHVESRDSFENFTTTNYGICTTSALEWAYTVDGARPPERQLFDKEGTHKIRKIKPLDELMRLDIVKSAGLRPEEVLSVSLYTGPMFIKYNACLRQGPTEGRNMYATTIFVLVSAVQKIARVTEISEELILYCGLDKVSDLPGAFANPDEFGSKGWTEFGFRSTSANKAVALTYSGVTQGNPHPMVMMIKPNSIDRGACIADLSQYQGEKEYLFPPCSFLQPNGLSTLEVTAEGVVNVIPMHLSINIKSETVDEVVQKKRRLHLDSGRLIVDELRDRLEVWASSAEATARLLHDPSSRDGTVSAGTLVSAILQQCNQVFDRHQKCSDEEYVNDDAFSYLVNEMLDAVAWGEEKKQLWMQDKSQYLLWLQNFSLHECHRVWQMFLRKSIANAKMIQPDDRNGLQESHMTSLCRQLLLSRRLLRPRLHEEANVDGESILVRAGADGWCAFDIQAAVAAGADISAADLDGKNGVWHAARCGHADALSALISVSCDRHKNMRDKYGASPVYAASYNGHITCLKALLDSNADVHACDKYGNSPICIACQQDQPSCIPLLISAKSDVNKSLEGNRFPVMISAMKGHSACLKLLLDARADPRIGGCDVAAVASVKQAGHHECARLLECALK